jgi:hypothetical protein
LNIAEQTQSRMVAQRSALPQTAAGIALIGVGIITAGAMRHAFPEGLLFLALAAFGVYQIVSAKRVTMVADKTAGTLAIAWRSLLGAGERSVSMANIDGITYRESISTERVTSDRWQWRRIRKDESVLYLKDGSSLTLDKERTSLGTVASLWSTLTRSSDREVDRALADFIGVPFYDNGATVLPTTSGQFGQSPPADSLTPECPAPSLSAAAPGAPTAPPDPDQAQPPWILSPPTAPPPPLDHPQP